MKKTWKIAWISLASLLGIVLLIIAIALFLLLNPKRLTSLVNKYASNFITCEYNFGEVNLSLFKTFPNIGLEINDLTVINPTENSPSDTLASVKECLVSLNIKKMLFDDEIIINTCQLNSGFINVFFNDDGTTNFDIFPLSETNNEPEEESTSYLIDLNKLRLNDINILYTDLSSNTDAKINGLALNLKGRLAQDVIKGDLELEINKVTANMSDDTETLNARAYDIMVKGGIDNEITAKGGNTTANTNISLGETAVAMTGELNAEANFQSLKLLIDGKLTDFEILEKTKINMLANNLNMLMDNEKLINNATLSLDMPLTADFSKMSFLLDPTRLAFNNIIIDASGSLFMNDDIVTNIDINTNNIIISELINIIPQSLRDEFLEGINVNGNISLLAHVEGVYNEQSMPVVTTTLSLNDGNVEMDEMLPYPLKNLNTSINANIDLNGKSDIKVNSFRANMNNSCLAASGTVNDLLGAMACNINMKASADLDDIRSFLPEDISAKGIMDADLNVKGTLDQFTNLDLMKTKIDGKISCKDLDVRCFDTIRVESSKIAFDFTIPNSPTNILNEGLAKINISCTDLNADIDKMLNTAIDGLFVDVQVSNVLDSTSTLAAIVDFGFDKLDLGMYDMSVFSNNATGRIATLPSSNIGNTYYGAVFSSDSLIFSKSDEMYFATESIALDLNADYDEEENDILLQWNPNLDLSLSNALFDYEALQEQVVLPNINITYNQTGLHVDNSNIVLGNSDFELSGDLTNLNDYIKNDELLKGEFSFTSNFTDINQIMEIFNGMGSNDTITAENQEQTAMASTDTTAVIDEPNPFMVPLGIDVTLHTNIKEASTGNLNIHNIGGDLTVKDGILVLQEMGFTSDAAEMQLTAIYKSKRKNHLYVGFDFHLMNIDIAEMLNIMPDLDTIVPMLKSFAGNAEFHFAAETNLKADYSPKFSTLKAACSIEGSNLVVLDTETFNTIKKLLLFNKKTDNVIDTLDVQFTVFKNEIDVYPFSIGMDKYNVALYGRHNLDMSYDYNIMVLSPNILNKLGLEIKGPDFDNMKFKVRRNRRANVFVPEKRDYKDEKILEIKKIIANSLKENVK